MNTDETYSRNEVIAEKFDTKVYAFRIIANHIEKRQMDTKEIVEWLRDMADEHEAQAMVVRLRDKL